jgi:hypothetical protein
MSAMCQLQTFLEGFHVVSFAARRGTAVHKNVWQRGDFDRSPVRPIALRSRAFVPLF